MEKFSEKLVVFLLKLWRTFRPPGARLLTPCWDLNSKRQPRRKKNFCQVESCFASCAEKFLSFGNFVLRTSFEIF
jgi:hypothetical protein